MSLSIGTVYTKPRFWKKGNRVATIGDSLTIKIGIDNDNKKENFNRESNRIKSTKYTLITFLPQNLLEQFRRIANFYFLIMTIIAIVIDSPVSPLTSLMPLVFVIAVTATKQGYEDYLRHKADNMVNYSLVTVLRNGVEIDIRCQDILQGDLVKVPRDCDVPCDLVLLTSSDIHNKCHITTANLDGETNLKTLVTPKGLPIVEYDKLHTLGTIECELPRTDLYTFNGRIELSPSFGRREITTDLENLNPELSNVLPLMAENLLLRGSRVKNTEYAIGCAVYTGQSTKLALNSRLTRNKVSSSEKYINKFLVFFLVLLIGMVTISYFLKRYFDLYHAHHNFYLGERIVTYQVSQFLQDYFSFLILYNYIIPISLYVTIEMHKFLGSFFLEWDTNLYDYGINQPCIVNTSDLNEELGQVRLLFSDKTGTLTKNEMIFQQCSINGILYRQVGSGLVKEGRNYITKIHNFKDDAFTFFEALSVCHTVQVAGDDYDEDNSVEQKEKVEHTYKFNNINEEIDFNRSTINDGEAIFDETDDNSTGMNLDHIHEIETIKTYDKNACELSIETKTPQQSAITIHEDHNQNIPSVTFDTSEYENIERNDLMTNNNNNNINNINNNNNININININNNNNNININNNNNINNNETRSSPQRIFRRSRRPLSLIENSTNPDRIFNTFNTNSLINSNNSFLLQDSNNLNPEHNIDFRHTFSHEMANNVSTNLTHRRTQSYAASTTLMRTCRIDESFFRGARSSNRSSMNRREGGVTSVMRNTREYYAAPSFTEASLVERKESVLRRNAIKSIIEQLDYQASSPDEKALVEACAKMGMVFTGDDDDILTIKLKTAFYQNKKEQNVDNFDAVLNNWREDNTNEKNFARLGVLDFTSDRKRMSIIVKDKTEQIWLYTKGAESHVLPLCTKTPDHLVASTQNHIDQFAKQGLRTLAVARRKVSALEFANYNNDLLHANNSLTDRKSLVEECQRNIETDLELLGATAVEDALQDNVRDTLESLRKAGIKVWVLTGDKVETALNIALSCGHIPDSAFKYFITDCKSEADLKEHLDVFNHEMTSNTNQIFTLLIDGTSLAIALKHCPELFRDIAINCRAVLCCRLSPLQKCEVVHLMKTVSDKPITAAIGDGANDVSMIQEAHVGLGIVGKEGRQAARCADYAFANFSMLKRILLVHGHYYSQRMATLVLYFFYKNLVFMMIQLIFQVFSMFSSQSIYDSVFLTLYNVVYTALPILVLSLTDKIYTEEELMANPNLYTKNTKNKRLSWKYFIGWMILAVYHGLIIFFFAYIIWFNNNIILPSMRDVNFYCFGTFLVHNIVVVVNLKLWLEAYYQTYFFIISIWLSIFGFMLTTVLYNLFDVNYDGNMLWVYNNLLSSYTFWLLSSIITIAVLLPDYTLKVCQYLDIHIGRIFPGPIEEKQPVIKHNLQFSRQTSRLTEVLSRQTSRIEETLSTRPTSRLPESITRQTSVLSQNEVGQRPHSHITEQLASNINNASRPTSTVPDLITRQSSRITDSTYL